MLQIEYSNIQDVPFTSGKCGNLSPYSDTLQTQYFIDDQIKKQHIYRWWNLIQS